MANPSSILDIIDTTTILSLLSTLAILATAYALSLTALAPPTTLKTRILFIWHAFDALIHFILEGSYLYNCFFSYLDLTVPYNPLSAQDASIGSVVGSGHGIDDVSEFLPQGVFFLGRRDRVYGALYGASPLSALWREYARADRRWAGSDLTVVSLELLTVFLMAPIAVWVCVCLSRRGSRGKRAGVAAGERAGGGAEWFWMVVVATGELYGGESSDPFFFLRVIH